LPLFNYFNQELLNVIIGKSELKEYSKGTPVIVQGEEGKNLFVLLSGSLQVEKRHTSNRPKALAEIYPPSIFGEIAVIEEVRRAADVVATSPSIVLEVPAKLLRQLAEESQYIRELDSFRNAIMVSQFFSSAPVFRDISESVVHLFTAKGKIESFEKDQIIFKQGDPGDGFYLLLRGSVGVSVNGRPIARIQQGGFFGEVSMIADVPRTATIYALEGTQILKINRDAFWEILSHDITMAMFIESVGEMRIREDIEILKAGTVRVA
jgi:CRP-like cAMP-binding protein